MAAIIRCCEEQVAVPRSSSGRPLNEPGGCTAGTTATAAVHRSGRSIYHSFRHQGGTSTKDDKLLPTTRKGLVALHLRLKTVLANEKRQRGMYELYVRQALEFHSLFEYLDAPSGIAHVATHHSSVHVPTTTAMSRYRKEASRWHSDIKPLLYRVSATMATVLSFVVIWCEGTIMLDGEPFHLNLSPLSYLFSSLGKGGGDAVVIACLFIPLLYCALCTYFAMFRMKLCEGMSLHPHQHSDGSALLFNATYACRLGPAICFNYLKLLHEGRRHDTPFYQRSATAPPGAPYTKSYFSDTAFGEMDQIPAPFGGDYFNNYAPIIIVILCGCTYLNIGTGILACCARCFPCVANDAFSFDDDFSDARIDHGAQILLHEKQVICADVKPRNPPIL